jgi:hypothetical protein
VVRDAPTVTTLVLPPPDVGSLIASFLTTAMPIAPVQTVHLEQSETGWLELITPGPGIVSSEAAGPHLEVSTDGFGHLITPPAPNNPPQVTQPGPGASVPPYVPIPVVTPPPAITQGGLTLTPVPVTSVRITTVDGKPTTVDAIVNFRYVVGSATLAVGTPTTIDNVPVALSIDRSGSTILVAGGQTTTLLAPARGGQGAAQASSSLQAVSISTTVIDGTTKYVLGGQTLAPGQAVTVGDIPLSIGTSGSATVLVLGDFTTTLLASVPTTTARDSGGSTAPTPSIATATGPSKPAATSATAAAEALRPISRLLTRLVAFAALAQPFV